MSHVSWMLGKHVQWGISIMSSLNNICSFKLVSLTSRKIKLLKIPSEFSVGPVVVYNQLWQMFPFLFYAHKMTKPLTSKAQHISHNVILFINSFSFFCLAGPLHSNSREMERFQLKMSNPPQSWLLWFSLAHLSVNKPGTFVWFWNHYHSVGLRR